MTPAGLPMNEDEERTVRLRIGFWRVATALSGDRPAEDAGRAKAELFADLSHELRTPLNAILGFAELIVSGALGPLDEPYLGYISDIRDSGRRLNRVVTDVLDAAEELLEFETAQELVLNADLRARAGAAPAEAAAVLPRRRARASA